MTPFSGSPDDWIEPVIKDLRRCGLLHGNDRILCRKTLLLRYANVIFDLDRAAALKTVHGYLDDLGIAYCGRYGDWGYMWTDESFKSGENAAQKALALLNTPHSVQPVQSNESSQPVAGVEAPSNDQSVETLPSRPS